MRVETVLLNKYRAIPVVSRNLFTFSLALTFLTYMNYLSPYTLIYSWAHMKRFEIWRAVTTFFYWGPPTADVLIHQTFMLKYSIMLEESFSDPLDFLFMLGFGMVAILSCANAFGITKLSGALSTYIIYIWSKKNPGIMISYMDVIGFPAYWVPCVMLAASILIEQRVPVSDISGMVAGHLYYYLKTVYRTAGARDVLAAPSWLKSLLRRKNTNRPPNGSEDPARDLQTGVRAVAA